MCSCDGAFVCSRCRAIDARDLAILDVPDDEEWAGWKKYETEHAQAPGDETMAA